MGIRKEFVYLIEMYLAKGRMDIGSLEHNGGVEIDTPFGLISSQVKGKED